jgi:hypothetical protein
MEIPRILFQPAMRISSEHTIDAASTYLAQLDTGADRTASFLHVVIGVDPFDACHDGID